MLARMTDCSWFKACAAATAGFTLWLACEGSAHAAVREAERAQAMKVEEVAARLALDPEQVRGGSSWEERARSAAAARRAEALKKLQALTAPDSRILAERERVAASIRAAHEPDLLAGIARAAQEARDAARASARPDPHGVATARLRAAGAAIAVGVERARSTHLPTVSAALSKARALANTASAAARGTRVERADAEAVERASPARKLRSAPNRRPSLAESAAPPEPRTGPRLGASVSPELREFYASILDAPGAYVETTAGAIDPALLAAGIAPSVRVASAGLTSDAAGLLGYLADGALPAPGDADLAETPDVRITPELRSAVASVGNDPIALFNLVHDGFEPEPYYGSKKGSVGAWEERAGNDADLSSVLVALLRAAGIPARYEYGTVEITPEQAMAWTGTTDVSAAADVLYSSGIPTTRIREGARIVAVRIEHVWVRAYVPYSNYRGLPRAGSRSMWVRLDPTLKRARVRSAVDLRSQAELDLGGFLSKVSGTTPLDALEAKLRGYVTANGLSCKSLEDAIPAREIIRDGLGVLPAELPASLVSSLASYAGLPAAMRHRATIGVGEWSITLSLPEVYGSALALRYRGARSTDQAAIDGAGAVASLAAPSTVQIVPTLIVDGVERGRGAAVVPGTDQDVTVSLGIPHGSAALITHAIVAGSVYAIAFPVGTVPDSVVARREAELSAAVAAGARGDDLEVARGNRTLWKYFWHSDRDEPRMFGLGWMRIARDVSEGIAGRELAPDLLYGVPVRVKPGRFVIDIPRYSMRPYGIDGDQSRVARTALLAGYEGSTREHLVWEETVHSPAISTVRILQAASEQGIPALRIDSTNAGLVASLPYSADARQDLTDKIHAGLVATVPERPVTWAAFPSAEGYVLEDPLTGAADFRIIGTFSGGAANGEGAPSGVSGPVCTTCNQPASSTVSLSLGNMYFAETDLSVPARGIPIAFTRRYDSMNPYGGRLGPGWQHAYEVRVVTQPDGSVLFVNDAFRTQRFLPDGSGGFSAEPGYSEKLASVADGWRITFKDGVEYRFRTDGQLRSIQDPNDHVVLCEYDGSSRLSRVVDSTMRTALSFEYDAAGALSAVIDAFGRRVVFGHDGGDLTTVTDVVGQVEHFAYDGSHRIVSKSDKSGNATLEFYDREGRWIGSREPDGTGRAVSYDFVNRRALHTDKTGAVTIWEYNERGNPVATTDAVGNRRTMEWDGASHKSADVDARGGRTEMSYDADGNLLTRKNALGATTAYTYNARGQVLTVTDPGGKVTVNVYDAGGNLQSSTDPAGATTSYGYTGDGLPQTITQPGGAVTTLAYRADGTVESITDPEGGKTTLAYDAYGHLSTITDALQNARTLESDAAGQIHSMADAAGQKTTFEYDAQGNRTAVIDPAGHRTSFGYDALNRLVTVTDAQGHVTRTEYDPEGRITARVDATGRRTEYRYDALGRLVETVNPSGAVTTQGYCADASSQACAIVDPLGSTTQVQFDALGRPTMTIDANGVATTDHYDARGRRDWSKDGAGATTSYPYDDAGRLTRVTDPLGGVTAYGYDGRGNRTSVTDANGRATVFTYDRANRLETETNPIGNVTRYEYDAAGNRRFKIDGNGVRIEYVYDANRRLRQVRFPDGTSYQYDYDARGNRTREVNAASGGPIHERSLAYDALGRLEKVEDKTLGRTLTYGYDANGNRSSLSVDTGEQVQYRWDTAGRLMDVVDPEGQTTHFAYDAAGRRTRATYGNGTAATYAYDAAGQVLSIVYANRAGEVLTAFGYAYDTRGNRLSKAFADGSKEAYGYDALNRLTAADYPDRRHVEYGYDRVGNRVALLDTGRSATLWATTATASSEYTSTSGAAKGAIGAPDQVGCQRNVTAGQWWPRTAAQPAWLEVGFGQAQRANGLRVVEENVGSFVMRVDLVDEGGGTHTVYEGGDQTGCGGTLRIGFGLTDYRVKGAKMYVNTPSSYAAVDAVGLEVPKTETYAYNGFNQLTSVSGVDGSRTTFGYDGNGNQVRKQDGSGITQYTYNQDNRLVGISPPSGVSDTFEYDANGLRTKKTDGAGTTRYLLDGLSVIAQYATNGQRQAWYTQSLARIDEVLSVVNGQGKFWYQADALESVYALTTAAGDVQARGGYDAFGEPVAMGGQTVGQPFGFTGREHDLDAGLTYHRDRYLQVGIGVWTQRDRLGVLAGPNQYQYTARPVAYTDPSGFYAKSTVDAYAVQHPVSFVMLLIDLGMVAAENAMMIVQAISMLEGARMRYFAQSCVDTEDTARPPATYYRGLEMRDLREYENEGIVQSRFMRNGGDIGSAASIASDPRRALDHMYGGVFNSPWISVTKYESVARTYANGYGPNGEQASGKVLRIITRRQAFPPEFGEPEHVEEGEYLLFYMLGFPADSLSLVE